MHAIEKKLRGEEIETTDLKQLEVRDDDILPSLPTLIVLISWSDRSNEREREIGSEASLEDAKR
jgi:hypothetical protein